MASQPNVILTAGKLRLELSPSVGGSIATFEWIDGEQPRSQYCANATIAWKMSSTRPASRSCLTSTAFATVDSTSAGARWSLRRTWPATLAHCTARGGSGRGRSRTPSETTATLSFQHVAGEWPWDYEARQQFALDERGLLAPSHLPQHVGRTDALRPRPASLFPLRTGHTAGHACDARLDDRRQGAAGRQGACRRPL